MKFNSYSKSLQDLKAFSWFSGIVVTGFLLSGGGAALTGTMIVSAAITLTEHAYKDLN